MAMRNHFLSSVRVRLVAASAQLRRGVAILIGVSLLAVACVESPAAPPNALRFTAITAGRHHTCALGSSGEAYCWGGQVTSGDVGFGSPSSKIAHSQPTAVNGGLRFVALSRSSGDKTCGITATGAAYCWDATLTPLAVASSVSFAALATADDTACGLDANQVAYCWGANNSIGQLGTGSFAPPGSQSPIPVTGMMKFSQIATSSFGHSCGLSDAGAAYCWGQNGWGQLGDGTQENRSAPTAVSGGVSFVELTAGWLHTCGLTATGAAYCWGSGQMVDGSTVHILSPFAVSGGLTFRTISAGAGHTCGLTPDGSAYCWGSDPASAQAGVPTAIPGGFSFTSLTTGGDHACGLATDGRVYCWGQNGLGQLGDGTVTAQSSPTLVTRQQPD
jgi:alpha-tubulin suppressor-like RCC1 family protein